MFENKGAEMNMPSTLSPEIRSKVVRKRAVYGGAAGLAILAALVALFVWSGASNDTTPEFAPANDPEAVQPAGRQLDAGTMEAGTYSIDEFEFAPFSIEVAEGDEWQPKIWGPGMFEMGHLGTDGGFITFFQEFDEVIDPKHALQGGVAAPTDLRGWFLDHPALDVTNVTELEVDGYPATSFDVVYNGLRPSSCGRGCWQIAPASEFWGGAMFLHDADGKQRLVIIEAPQGKVIVLMNDMGEPNSKLIEGPATDALLSVDFAD
jgi:hypothetical protein